MHWFGQTQRPLPMCALASTTASTQACAGHQQVTSLPIAAAQPRHARNTPRADFMCGVVPGLGRLLFWLVYRMYVVGCVTLNHVVTMCFTADHW
jgi:hypothetical protein